MIKEQIIIISCCIQKCQSISIFRFNGYYLGRKIRLIKIRNSNPQFTIELNNEYVVLIKIVQVKDQILFGDLLWCRKLEAFSLFNS
jgi:hypothetical protein